MMRSELWRASRTMSAIGASSFETRLRGRLLRMGGIVPVRQSLGILSMSIADKLVLQRQRHLKWRSVDKLKLIVMILCGLLCFGFSLSVTDDIVTRTMGRPWLWLQEVTFTLFIDPIYVSRRIS